MKAVKLVTSLAVALLAAAPFASFAQDAEETPLINWSLAATSDYVWRGVSQSDENPTGQAGLTFNAPGGFYIGTWASGVDFGAGDPDFEVDYFVGYNVDFSDTVNFDVMLNRYSYPGASELNFNELITKTTFVDTYSLTVAYTNDFGGSDTKAWYVNGGASFGLPNDFSLDLGVGRSMFESSFSDDYTDWSIGVGKTFGWLTASLGYVGTDSKGRSSSMFGELADSRVVLTLSAGN